MSSIIGQTMDAGGLINDAPELSHDAFTQAPPRSLFDVLEGIEDALHSHHHDRVDEHCDMVQWRFDCLELALTTLHKTIGAKADPDEVVTVADQYFSYIVSGKKGE